MEKTIGAFEARRQFGSILQDVTARGDEFVVERHGEPVAALVPIELYERWKRQREEFFAQMHEIAARSNLTPEEADALATEAVQAARAAQVSQ